MKMVVAAALLLVNMCLQSFLVTLLIYRNNIKNLLLWPLAYLSLTYNYIK